MQNEWPFEMAWQQTLLIALVRLMGDLFNFGVEFPLVYSQPN